MLRRPACLIIVPFGKAPDDSGRIVDFDAVYSDVIEPTARGMGFDAVRADCHKAASDRFALSEYVIVDLTIFDPNLYYELGARHALRPRATALIASASSRLISTSCICPPNAMRSTRRGGRRTQQGLAPRS